MTSTKPAIKPVKLKDVSTRNDPRGGVSKPETPIATPRVETTMREVVSTKLTE